MNACIKGRGGSGGTESCIDQQAINEAKKAIKHILRPRTVYKRQTQFGMQMKNPQSRG